MQSTNIKWFSRKKGGLNQIYSKGIEFALVSKNKEQCHPFIICKDWLQDAIWANLWGKTAAIYGFEHNPSLDPKVDFDNTNIVILNKQDTKLGEKIPLILDFLNQFNDKLGMSKTEAFVVNNVEEISYPEAYLLVGDKNWEIAPPMISLYSLLIRAGACHVLGQTWIQTLESIINGSVKAYQSHDQSYLSQSIIKIKRIMEIGYEIIFYKDIKQNYPEDINMSALHNSSGIVSLARGITNNITEYWNRPELGNAAKINELKLKEISKVKIIKKKVKIVKKEAIAA